MNETRERKKTSRTRREKPVTFEFQAVQEPEVLPKGRPTPTPEVFPKRRPEVNPAPKIRVSGQPVAPKFASETGETELKPKFVWRLSSTTRIRLGVLVITLIALTLIARLFALQVQQSPYGDLRKRAQAMHMKETTIPARRGVIMDANGLVLASNISVYRVWGSPTGLTEKQAEKTVAAVVKALPTVPESKIREALTYKAKTSNYNLIAKDVDSATADKLKDLRGIDLEAQTRRVYPNGQMLGQMMGFTNFEGVGAYGIEGRYDEDLRGKPATFIAETDPDGNPIVLGQRRIDNPIDGVDLTLTIDSSIQIMVERELKKGMDEHKAEAAYAIVMDPNTGAILAWASFPNYDPNNFGKTDPKLLKDPIVSDTYEPGSTFKILTAAIGIDTGVVTPESWADLPGCVIKYSQRICNYNSVGYSHQTVVDTLEHSSNVGAMWIAEKFGPQKYYDYLKRFGIGALTGIDLQGEANSLIRWQENKDWIPLDMLTNSFGQSVAVTPIQLVTAVSAVANGGNVVKPYIVAKKTRDGKVIQETKSQIVRSGIIKPQSAKTTTDMLVQAVRKGETRLADVKGYRVAGKTGTATLYNSDLTIGSTIAYAPADNPRFIVLVRYDKTKDTPWGSNTAAPVVKTITENLFNYYNIPPTEPVDPKKP